MIHGSRSLGELIWWEKEPQCCRVGGVLITERGVRIKDRERKREREWEKSEKKCAGDCLRKLFPKIIDWKNKRFKYRQFFVNSRVQSLKIQRSASLSGFCLVVFLCWRRATPASSQHSVRIPWVTWSEIVPLRGVLLDREDMASLLAKYPVAPLGWPVCQHRNKASEDSKPWCQLQVAIYHKLWIAAPSCDCFLGQAIPATMQWDPPPGVQCSLCFARISEVLGFETQPCLI